MSFDEDDVRDLMTVVDAPDTTSSSTRAAACAKSGHRSPDLAMRAIVSRGQQANRPTCQQA